MHSQIHPAFAHHTPDDRAAITELNYLLQFILVQMVNVHRLAPVSQDLLLLFSLSLLLASLLVSLLCVYKQLCHHHHPLGSLLEAI